MNYTFPKPNLALVTDHASALDVEVLSLTLNGDQYLMSTLQPFPEEQLEHLALVEVV